MTLELVPMGRLRVWAALEKVIDGRGPISHRTISVFDRVLWETDDFTLETASGSGAYAMGEDVAQIDVKVGFRDGNDVCLFLEYSTRASMRLLRNGEGPGYMTGRVDVTEEASRYAWLNRTQLVGKGMLTFDPIVLDYELYALL